MAVCSQVPYGLGHQVRVLMLRGWSNLFGPVLMPQVGCKGRFTHPHLQSLRPCVLPCWLSAYPCGHVQQTASSSLRLQAQGTPMMCTWRYKSHTYISTYVHLYARKATQATHFAAKTQHARAFAMVAWCLAPTDTMAYAVLMRG